MTSKDDKAQNPVCVAQSAAPEQQVGCIQRVSPVIILNDSAFKLVKPALSVTLLASFCAERQRRAL